METQIAMSGYGTCTLAKYFADALGSASWRMPSQMNTLDSNTHPSANAS